METENLTHENLDGFADPEHFPWDRQPRESEKAFKAFKIFREHDGQRTSHVVDEQLQCSGQNIRRWAKKWKWHERAREWDIYQDRIAQEAIIRERLKMIERHAQQGRTLQGIAAQQLLKLQQLQADPQRKLEPLSVRDIAYLMEVGTRMERRALGEPDGKAVPKIEVLVELDEPPAEEKELLHPAGIPQ